MKRILCLILILSEFAAISATLKVPTRDFTSEPTIRRRTTLTLSEEGPVTAPPWLIAGDSVAAFTDTNGVAWYSNVLAAKYNLNISGSPGRSFPISVFDTNGILDAAVLVNSTNYNAAYYTAAQVDALIADIEGGGGGGGTSGALTNDDTRNVSLAKTLTLGSAATDGSITLTDGDTRSFSATISADGWIFEQPVEATGFIGDGSNLTDLSGSAITSGTISSNKMDATAHVAYANDVTAAGLAAGSHVIDGRLMTNNVILISGTNVVRLSSNGISIYRNSRATNAGVFVGNGSIQLPQKNYGIQDNLRNGIEFWANFSGTGEEFPPGDATSVPIAFIHCETNWGNSGAIATLHFASRGNMRIEPGFSAFHGSNYLSLGNEDSNTRMFVNQADAQTDLPGEQSGYSLPLQLQVTGKRNGNLFYGSPGIQGYFENTNVVGRSDLLGSTWHLGGLKFFALSPDRDLTNGTFGVQNPNFHLEVGRTLTNGWRFNGNVEYKMTTPILDVDTNIVLDFNADSYSVLNLPHPVATNYIQATNMNTYGGNTNYTVKVFKIASGAIAKPLKFPSSWTVVSESGSAALPTLLEAQKVMILKLQAFGDTNVVADYKTGTDASFAFDSDASSFSNRVGTSLSSTQMGAVDYLVKALKATTILNSNLWSKTRVLYPMVGGTSNAHAMNLRSTSYPVIYTSSGITHDANGITGNGSSGYGNTQFTHNNAGAETNMHLIVYCRTTAPVDAGRFIGAYNSSGTQRSGLLRNGASLGTDGPMNGNAPMTAQNVSTDFRGVLGVTRPNNDPNLIYSMNRSAFATNSSAAVGSIPVTYDLLARHAQSGDAHFNFSDANLALVSIGDGLTTAEMEAYRAIINNFQSILGRNVP